MSSETKQKPKFYTKYDRVKTGEKTVVNGKNVNFSTFKFKQPSLTEKQFAYETNINNIVKGAISKLPPNYSKPHFGDFLDPNKYVESLNLVADAKNHFDMMPSDIRARFGNNPENLLKFMSDENNKEEAIKLGLIPQEEIIEVRYGDKFINGQYVGKASLEEISKYQTEEFSFKQDVTTVQVAK